MIKSMNQEISKKKKKQHKAYTYYKSGLQFAVYFTNFTK